MTAPMLTIVISYDICGASTRRRVSGLLEERMVRVQKSVFEGRLRADAAGRLFDDAEMLLEDGDSLRMYVLSATGRAKSRVAGGAPLPEEGDYWLL